MKNITFKHAIFFIFPLLFCVNTAFSKPCWGCCGDTNNPTDRPNSQKNIANIGNMEDPQPQQPNIDPMTGTVQLQTGLPRVLDQYGETDLIMTKHLQYN